MEKFVERTLLYDFYGELLTKRQQQINGGSVMYRIIYSLLGIAGMKLLRASLSHLRGGRVIRMK